MPSPIRLDYSSTGIVIVCAHCPWWSAFRFTREQAWACALAHEEREHPGETHQRRAAHTRSKRRDTPTIAAM